MNLVPHPPVATCMYTLCGSSLRNRKCDLIVRENPSQLQQAIHIELENRIARWQVIMIIYLVLFRFFFVIVINVIVNSSLQSDIVLEQCFSSLV